MKNYELVGERSKKGLTQADMASRMGVTLQTYHNKESGTRAFTLKDVEKISNILDLAIEDVDRIFFKNKLTKCIN
ncbi:helix-turn-helix protein [Andreesenia angusta]|uniref:Helix-turn-helix protein n=1 Tax=Andreesenia angusta TaxID=39480 RepID=A0A1S1V9N0_9FIRM|nr:helix-turn-helix transcriptional regulator [Andreesenia angusta]OHW63125.1 helix-turn-helix protein [Andreesenia angusta]